MILVRVRGIGVCAEVFPDQGDHNRSGYLEPNQVHPLMR
jgi:hypothetical protein